MPKFFVTHEQIKKNTVTITGSDVNHISNVLRLEPGEELCVCDKDLGQSYQCKIEKVNRDVVECKILHSVQESTEPITYIHVFQGLPKADKLEWIIEKCTEIGVKEITPVSMQRSIVKLTEKDKTKKLDRWRKLAEVASKQSGRDKILQVNPARNFKNVVENLQEYDIVIVAYEKETKNTLKKVLKAIDKTKESYCIAVIIGPEGGIDEAEISSVKQLGEKVQVVTLGKRILRTETAPLVVASNILYELEE